MLRVHYLVLIALLLGVNAAWGAKASEGAGSGGQSQAAQTPTKPAQRESSAQAPGKGGPPPEKRFKPSEHISADSAVSFPVDI